MFFAERYNKTDLYLCIFFFFLLDSQCKNLKVTIRRFIVVKQQKAGYTLCLGDHDGLLWY